MTSGDLYSLLGVRAGAGPDEIRAAYHEAARRFHPDVNPNPDAAEAFKQLADAYAVLSDPERRAAYDTAARADTGPLLTVRAVYSRPALPVLNEPQVLYTLLEIVTPECPDMAPPPVNVCLVIDRSTSMQGPRLDQVRSAVLQVIDCLAENDSFAVVAFSDRPEVVVPAQKGLAEKTIAKARVSTLSALGGTEMLQGLLCGLTQLHQNYSPAAVNHLLLLTDGRTYGDEPECLMLASLVVTDGISISGLGIGEDWNDAFLDSLTTRTGGTSAYIQSVGHIPDFVREQVRGLGNVFASRLALQVIRDAGIELVSAYRLSPDPGPMPPEAVLRIGSLPQASMARVMLKFRVPPSAAGDRPLARLMLTGDMPGLGRRDERVIIDLARPVAANAPPLSPPAAVLDALNLMSQYYMQDKVWQQIDAGDVAGGIEGLKALGTRLMASGQLDLARLAISSAAELERTRVMGEDVKKRIKYGTRALAIPTDDRNGIR